MGTIMMNVDNVSFSYGRKKSRVLDGFSMQLEKGAVYGLLGKNGTGKSTLLYLMAGLLRPQTGKVYYKGVDVTLRNPRTLQDIFLVPEEFALPNVSLKQYVKLNAPFYPKFSDEILKTCLRDFDMSEDLELGALSMGQKRCRMVIYPGETMRIPSLTLVAYEGDVYFPNRGSWNGFVGIDDQHILHVGKMTADDIAQKNIQYGVGFGPVLIANGEIALAEGNVGGLNPRTAIGQRSDGAMLLLVVDGRQALSIGCTYMDLCDIFFEYGAVNAYNLDGGSSTLMWYEDRYVNNCASVIGIRPVPTTFLVLKEGVEADG